VISQKPASREVAENVKNKQKILPEGFKFLILFFPAFPASPRETSFVPDRPDWG
jgi:hypothetical protein